LPVSALYVIVRRLLEFVVLLGRGNRAKELEILVLRHELSILRRQVNRSRFEPQDRLLLAALSRMLPRHLWNAFSVRPETTIARTGEEVTQLKAKRHTPEQIVRKLREAERLQAEGVDVDAICRQLDSGRQPVAQIDASRRRTVSTSPGRESAAAASTGCLMSRRFP